MLKICGYDKRHCGICLDTGVPLCPSSQALYHLLEGGYVCESCREADLQQDGTTPLILEDAGWRLLLAAHPTRYAPDFVAFELIWERWQRAQN